MTTYSLLTVDTSEAGSILGLLASRLQSGQLLEQVKGVLVDEIEAAFQNEKNPEGRQWAPLAAATIRQLRRQSYGGKMLQRTGLGKRSIKIQVTGRNRLAVSYLGYMDYHDKGTRFVPQRQFIPNKRDLETGRVGRRIKKVVEDFLNPSLGQFARNELARTPLLRKFVRG